MQSSVIEEGTPTEQSRHAIEALAPSISIRELRFAWTLPTGESRDVIYVQEPLGMFPSQEFITRISEIIDLFIQGEMGMKLGDLFRGEVEMPASFDPEIVNDAVEENIELIKAFIKLVQMLPDFQLDMMCLSLGIPRQQRNWAKEQLQEPVSRGGLSVDEGFDILIWFIRQNGPLLRETFLGKARELGDEFRIHVLNQEVETESDQTSSSSSSTASSLTPTTTPTPSSPGGTPSTISSPATPENV